MSLYSKKLFALFLVKYKKCISKLKSTQTKKKEQIIKKNQDTFEVWVKAPASEGRANIAVIKLLAKTLGIEAKLFKLIKGATSPSKIFEIRE